MDSIGSYEPVLSGATPPWRDVLLDIPEKSTGMKFVLDAYDMFGSVGVCNAELKCMLLKYCCGCSMGEMRYGCCIVVANSEDPGSEEMRLLSIAGPVERRFFVALLGFEPSVGSSPVGRRPAFCSEFARYSVGCEVIAWLSVFEFCLLYGCG